MLAGREVWGFPKKLGEDRLRARSRHDRRHAGAPGRREAGDGRRCVRSSRSPNSARTDRRRACASSLPPIPATTRPALAELIAADTRAQASARPGRDRPRSRFPDRSALDPVDRFPVRRIVKAIYMEYDIMLPAGRVIARGYEPRPACPRRLDFEGAVNFRDLGGYAAATGGERAGGGSFAPTVSPI